MPMKCSVQGNLQGQKVGCDLLSVWKVGRWVFPVGEGVIAKVHVFPSELINII